jgi:CBS domain-containing protein
MTEKLTRRGLRVQSDYAADVLSQLAVHDVMTTDIVTVRDSATVDEARLVLEGAKHHACPVVDAGGACVGIVTRDDVVQQEDGHGVSVLEVASRDIVTVGPDDSLLDALHKMLEEGITHLPVTDGGTLVGICTRADVLEARMRQFDLELLQRGWRFPLFHFRGRGRSASQTPGDGDGAAGPT